MQSRTEVSDGFRLSIDGFEGPFDLLLTLINRHELDITEVSLSLVTDEFISYIAGISDSSYEGLNHASEFLEVATTLLDMKIARLLPQGEVVDAEDVAALEARDLLFARLLQYRAYSQVSHWFDTQMREESQRITRQIAVPEEFRNAPAKLEFTLTLAEFAKLAETVCAAAPRTESPPVVSVSHVHAAPVSLRSQASFIVDLLQQHGNLGFHELIAGETKRNIIVARFLVLLELYRCEAIELAQLQPLSVLTVTWVWDNWDESKLTVFGDADG